MWGARPLSISLGRHLFIAGRRLTLWPPIFLLLLSNKIFSALSSLCYLLFPPPVSLFRPLSKTTIVGTASKELWWESRTIVRTKAFIGVERERQALRINMGIFPGPASIASILKRLGDRLPILPPAYSSDGLSSLRVFHIKMHQVSMKGKGMSHSYCRVEESWSFEIDSASKRGAISGAVETGSGIMKPTSNDWSTMHRMHNMTA